MVAGDADALADGFTLTPHDRLREWLDQVARRAMTYHSMTDVAVAVDDRRFTSSAKGSNSDPRWDLPAEPPG
jgi:hypothetical protein